MRTLLFVYLLSFAVSLDVRAEDTQHIRFDTKTGTSAAVVVNQSELVQTTQLSPRTRGSALPDKPAGQVRQLLGNLKLVMSASNAELSDIVKINAYAKNSAIVDELLGQLKTQLRGQPGPAFSVVTTRLPDPKAQVALDAIFRTSLSTTKKVQRARLANLGNTDGFSHTAKIPRGDLVFISGQAERGTLAEATKKTMQGLIRTLKYLQLDRSDVVQVKCFMLPMSDVATVEREIRAVFPGTLTPPISYVEWKSSLPIEIEIMAAAPASDSSDSVTYSTPPWMKSSPVFSRVASLSGSTRIFVSGLYGPSSKTAEDETLSLFKELDAILKDAGSDMRHLAKATYYVSNGEVSSALNAVRPSIYDPKRPPAASKAMVTGVGRKGRTLSVDMIAGPIRQ